MKNLTNEQIYQIFIFIQKHHEPKYLGERLYDLNLHGYEVNHTNVQNGKSYSLTRIGDPCRIKYIQFSMYRNGKFAYLFISKKLENKGPIYFNFNIKEDDPYWHRREIRSNKKDYPLGLKQFIYESTRSS